MWHRIGAVCYVIWGLLHVNAAYMQYQFGSSFETGMAHGRLIQNSWHLLFFGVVAIIVGVFRNWKNSRAGYWINVINLSVVDIGFILFCAAALSVHPVSCDIGPGVLGPGRTLLNTGLPERRDDALAARGPRDFCHGLLISEFKVTTNQRVGG